MGPGWPVGWTRNLELRVSTQGSHPKSFSPALKSSSPQETGFDTLIAFMCPQTKTSRCILASDASGKKTGLTFKVSARWRTSWGM